MIINMPNHHYGQYIFNAKCSMPFRFPTSLPGFAEPNKMSRQVDGSPMPPAVSKRPKSAAAFSPVNRRIVSPAAPNNSTRTELTSLNQHSLQQNRPQSSRHPRPPLASGATSPRSRPCSNTMQLWRQPGPPIVTRHSVVARRVMQEEIDEQRRVTLDAQHQLHELQTTITRRQEELELAHRHLQALNASSTASKVSTPSVLSAPSVSSTKTATTLVAVEESSTPATKAKTPSNDIVANLKDQIVRQDEYKKRLRYMHNRLAKHVQFLEANIDLLAERRKGAYKERSLCQSRVTLESNKNRQHQDQLNELHGKQEAFKRNALPVIESYRDEIASRLVMTQRRQDADRRREELLQFIGSKPSVSSSVTARSITSATAAIRKECTPFNRLQRRDSYNVLAADAEENKRETLFAVYEGQYDRVLRETGEADLNVVLERFQSYRESAVRLREIEIDLRAEGARLVREQQAHSTMISRLRVSGPTGVAERRQRVRDRLEGALHAQQLEKTQAREHAASQLKAFVYVQQGVLHIVELLQCLEDRTGMALMPAASLLVIARTAMGGAQSTEAVLKNVAPALQSLVNMSRDMGRRGLHREWLKLPALGYSVPQVARLEQFAPEGQIQRGPFINDEDERLEPDSCETENNQDEVDEERFDAAVMRQGIKRQEKETLRQAETILRQTADTRKLQQVELQQQQQPKQSPQQLKMQLLSDREVVAAHFREQRRAERQEQRFMNGDGSVLSTTRPQSISGNYNNGVVMNGVPSLRRRKVHPPAKPN